MVFDYRKLRGKIVEVFGSQVAFAKEIGISERTISLKLNGKVFFSQDEILKASELLHLNETEIPVYFFTEKVQ